VSLYTEEITSILDSTYEGIMVINNQKIVTVFNKAAENIIGLSSSKVLNHQVIEAIPNTRLHLVLESGIPELDKQQQIGNTTILTNRVPILNNRNQIIGAVAVFRNISDIVRLAETITELRETEALLKAIINSTHDAITVVNEKGEGIMINPAYTRLTGLTEKDVLGKPATVDIAEGDSIHIKVLQTRKPIVSIPMKVGPKKKEVLVSCAPIMVNKKLKGSVGVIHDISEIHRLSEELERAKQLIRYLEAKYTFEDIIGNSLALSQSIELAKRAASTPATVLLRGESGTGKELFAHAIHHASNRAKGKFVRVNCAAIPESLLESELFGYVEGAFTGANRGGKQGYFQEADGGTLFLDEIAEIGTHTQAKLLRILQEKEVLPVGATKPIPVDVRILTATNANLEYLVKQGILRQELYYRLNVIPIVIPALRERKEDIPQLAQHIICKFNQEYGRNVSSISQPCLEILKKYQWPGNVRELENILGRAMINLKNSDMEICTQHLPPLEILQNPSEKNSPLPLLNYENETLNYKQLREQWERELFKAVMKETNGNKTAAAQKLQISIRTFYNKLEKLGLY